MTAYCPNCDGTNVHHDALVGANDSTDIRTFDSGWCDDCEVVLKHLNYKEHN